MSLNLHMEGLAALIRVTRFNFSTENELQQGIEQLLRASRLTFEREYIIDSKNRIDFFFPATGIGIETKIAGSFGEITRQIHRYAQFDLIQGILVVSRRANAGDLPETINNKPIIVVSLWRNFL